MSPRAFTSLVVGVAFTIVATLLVDTLLRTYDVFPSADLPMSTQSAVLALAYRVAIGFVAGQIAAAISPWNFSTHAVILGLAVIVANLFGIATIWNRGIGPQWYPIAILVLAIPQSVAGAKTYEWRRNNRGRNRRTNQ